MAKEKAIDVEGPAKDIKTLQEEILEMQKQLKLAAQNREEENLEFQKVVKEQRKTQVLLKEALKSLSKFYNKGAFLQGSKRSAEARLSSDLRAV